MPSNTLEERIRELCAKVKSAHGEELADIISELQSTLHMHAERTKKISSATLKRIQQAVKRPAM